MRQLVHVGIMPRSFLVLWAWPIFAEATTPEQNGEQEMDEIIVVGTAGGQGVRRMDAGFAVSSIKPEEITKISPKSTADLLKNIPGVWSESSGGVAGANIDVRGLPGGSDAPFVTIAIEGMPVFGTDTLSFFEQSSIFRIDETIAHVDALRGGPNSVFGKGEPGLTADFALKEGGPDTSGLIKFGMTDFGELRLDGALSGEITNDLFYMIGGYYRASDGLRDTQFRSENGYQLTANITRPFSSGKLSAYARYTDDHGQWVLPMALNIGNDLGTFSPLGSATRYRNLQVDEDGKSTTFDFSKGRGWKGLVAGGGIEYDLGGGFSLRDKLSFTDGDADTYGFVPDGAPVMASELGSSVMTAGGAGLEGSDYVQNYGHWVVQKKLRSLSNDLSLEKYFNGGHDVTVGYYHSTWSSADFWTIGNFTPIHAVANGDYISADISCEDLTDAGSGSNCWRYGIDSDGDAKVDAIYGADSWQITDALRLDLGVRYEWLTLSYLLDSGPGYPDGTQDKDIDRSDAQLAYTAGVNYRASHDLALFARYSDGFTWPHFDNLREGNESVKDIRQTEAGVKYLGDNVEAFATLFHNNTDSFSSVVGAVAPPAVLKTKAYGLEVNGLARAGNLSGRILATWQHAEVTDSSTPSDIGNEVLRQPNIQMRLSPEYCSKGRSWEATAYGGYSYIGRRYGDYANTVILPSYNKFDIGLLVRLDKGLSLQIHGDNVGNSHGITEGDPRNANAPNGRPIFGRSIKLTAGYEF